MKQRISSVILQMYYDLWLSGATPSIIRKKLKLSVAKFKEYAPDFLTYCRHQIKYDTRIQLTKDVEPDLVKLTPARVEEFLFHIGTSLSIPDTALIMGIPLITITDFWFKDSCFKAKVDHAVLLVNANVKRALYRRATGYEYDGGHITETRGTRTVTEGVGKDKIEKEIPFHNVTEIRKINVVEPDVNASKFWLYNRVPDEFSVDGQRTNINNKGKILQWIEEQTQDVDDKGMDNFDKEQDVYDKKYNRK